MIQGEVTLGDLLPVVRPGDRLEFGRGGYALAYLANGWSVPEPWGTWSEGAGATLDLPVIGSFKVVDIEARALVTPAHSEQRIRVFLNDVLVREAVLTKNVGNRITIPVLNGFESLIQQKGYLNLRFEFLDAIKPADLEINDDARALALGLTSITLQ
jgi:hypothetical protein